MDETWLWRYYQVKKGVAPPGATLGGVKSRKGARLIIVDASTADGQVSHGQYTSLKMFLYI